MAGRVCYSERPQCLVDEGLAVVLLRGSRSIKFAVLVSACSLPLKDCSVRNTVQGHSPVYFSFAYTPTRKKSKGAKLENTAPEKIKT